MILLALDGHDGVGKTTLARLLARRIGAHYYHPFAGQRGQHMLDSQRRGDFRDVLRTAHACLVDARLRSASYGVAIFDRAWLTVYTLVPESLHELLSPDIPTMLLHATPATTRQRLTDTGQATWPLRENRYWTELYFMLAAKYGCPSMSTDKLSPPEALELLIPWAHATMAEARASHA